MLFSFLMLWLSASSVSHGQLSHSRNRWFMSTRHKLYTYIYYTWMCIRDLRKATFKNCVWVRWLLHQCPVVLPCDTGLGPGMSSLYQEKLSLFSYVVLLLVVWQSQQQRRLTWTARLLPSSPSNSKSIAATKTEFIATVIKLPHSVQSVYQLLHCLDFPLLLL